MLPKIVGGIMIVVAGGILLWGALPEAATAAAEQGAEDAATQALREHLSAAVERFEAEGLAEGQQDALIENPDLESAFRGQRIDSFFKQSLNQAIEQGSDQRVANLYVTRSGEFGPELFDLGSIVVGGMSPPRDHGSLT